jgi:hypothetical protein
LAGKCLRQDIADVPAEDDDDYIDISKTTNNHLSVSGIPSSGQIMPDRRRFG